MLSLTFFYFKGGHLLCGQIVTVDWIVALQWPVVKRLVDSNVLFLKASNWCDFERHRRAREFEFVFVHHFNDVVIRRIVLVTWRAKLDMGDFGINIHYRRGRGGGFVVGQMRWLTACTLTLRLGSTSESDSTRWLSRRGVCPNSPITVTLDPACSHRTD